MFTLGGSSTESNSSYLSFVSRGSRQGRRRWAQRTAFPYPSPTKHRSSSGTSERQTSRPNREKGSMFCTWSGCTAKFRTRYDWARHEEAVHYYPYHWVCCLEEANPTVLATCFVCDAENVTLEHIAYVHFGKCVTQNRADRTFFRSDQLSQHIKGVHLAAKTKCRLPKDVLDAWRIDNPSLLPSALFCGFCWTTFSTWAERQDHVFGHFQKGATKCDWNSDDGVISSDSDDDDLVDEIEDESDDDEDWEDDCEESFDDDQRCDTDADVFSRPIQTEVHTRRSLLSMMQAYSGTHTTS